METVYIYIHKFYLKNNKTMKLFKEKKKKTVMKIEKN